MAPLKARRLPGAIRPRDVGRDEASIQARIVQLLELNGWFVLVSDRASMGKSGHKGAFEPGWPDVQAWKGARYLLLECKTPTGQLRPDQKRVHARLAACGIPVHVPRDEADVLPLLRPRGLP